MTTAEHRFIPVNLDELWTDLNTGLTNVYKHNAMPKQNYAVLYSKVFNYCTNVSQNNCTFWGLGPSKKLKKAGPNIPGAHFAGLVLYKKIKEFLINHVESITRKGEGKVDEGILKFYKKRWEEFWFSSQVLNGICAYLNRYWVPKEINDGRVGIYEMSNMALLLWRDTVFKTYHETITRSMLNLINRERRGERIQQRYVADILNSYVCLGIDESNASQKDGTLSVYTYAFEQDYLDSTAEFYAVESREYLPSHTIPEYMKKVETRIDEEEFRVRLYLHDRTYAKVMKVLEDTLIKDHLNELHQEFTPILKSKNREDIMRMYALCSRTPNGALNLREQFEEYVVKEGQLAVSTCHERVNRDARRYINTLLGVYARNRILVLSAFKNNPGFVEALDKGCRVYVNDNVVANSAQDRTEEMLAYYTDIVLRKPSSSSAKNMGGADLENCLNQIMILFHYLNSKDIFREFYLKHFAKRLINNKSASEEAEISMVARLRTAQGYDYISKPQRMIHDMQVNRERQTAFKNSDIYATLNVDMRMLVLTSNSWPYSAANVPPVVLPEQLAQCHGAYTTFYAGHHDGRRLNWLYQLCQAEMRLIGYDKPYTLEATLFPILVLEQFNAQDNFSMLALKQNTQLDQASLQQAVELLIVNKLLKCKRNVSGYKDLADEETIELNHEFSSDKLRVQLTLGVRPAVGAESQQREKVLEKVGDERNGIAKCAIVRVMKSRRVLHHSNLITEVINIVSSRFKPSIPFLQDMIEMMIEETYIQRSTTDRNVYEYLAGDPKATKDGNEIEGEANQSDD